MRSGEDAPPLGYSLAGPVVGDAAVQRDAVAEVGVVAVLLPQVLGVALLGRRQRGGAPASAPTPEALDQTQRFGQTWARQTRLVVQILRTHRAPRFTPSIQSAPNLTSRGPSSRWLQPHGLTDRQTDGLLLQFCETINTRVPFKTGLRDEALPRLALEIKHFEEWN